jgi:hypothetical protein
LRAKPALSSVEGPIRVHPWFLSLTRTSRNQTGRKLETGNRKRETGNEKRSGSISEISGFPFSVSGFLSFIFLSGMLKTFPRKRLFVAGALPPNSDSVIPAQAGIHPEKAKTCEGLDSPFCGNDRRSAWMSLRTKPVAGIGVVAALATALAAPAWAFERTEEREPCGNFNALRNPYFGDTHVHTAFSFDASALGVRAQPRDAYRFARGEPLDVRPYDDAGRGLRRARLRRPLDFAAVTDHAELLGERHICQAPGVPGHDSLVCRVYRRWPLLAYILVSGRMMNVDNPQRYGFCGPNGMLCREAALAPWRRIQEAAEEAYDRSSACRFTSFVGYEWSGNPESNMIHRNVIFRNAVVPEYPTSYVDHPHAEGLWQALHRDCLEQNNGCDVLTIPHNSNLSGGWLFRTESAGGTPTAAEARRRAALEPLIEVLQHKGDSECRLGAASEDELCGFEKLPYGRMDQRNVRSWWKPPAPMSFAREALGAGLVEQSRLGVNPFKYGLIASTDTHIGAPGFADEDQFLGHAAGGDTSNLEQPLMPDAIEFNPGGLAVFWAEENSRDAIFTAMRRREAYGTSGPRIVVRFFGGWSFAPDLCGDKDFVTRGYRDGVPMGGDLPARPPAAAVPTFAVWALRDPGTAGAPGAPLQRVQVVKLWLANGTVQERVYDVAGDRNNGAAVDLRTCARQGPGFDDLCAVWRDPAFDRSAPALYYARVIENPSCRWSTYVCNAHGVDCSRPRSVPRELAVCCDQDYPRTIQERAWTSPIWYTPQREGT